MRGAPDDVAERFKGGAGVRGLAQAAYLEKLLALLSHAQARVQAGDAYLEELLAKLGLEPVTR